MTYAEFVAAIQGASNTDSATTRRVLRAVVDVTGNVLKRGESIRFQGFGIIYVGKFTARWQINPRTGQRIRVPAKRIAKTRMSSNLSQLIN
jgi:DNA-binding protein HU-beta